MSNRKNLKTVTVTIASAAAAYSSGDQVGIPVEIPGAVSDGGVLTELKSLLVREKNGTAIACTVLIFNSQPTMTSGDNDAVSANTTALAKLIAMPQVVIADTIDLASVSSGHVRAADFGQVLKPLLTNSKSLWCVFVIQTGATLAANGIDLVFGFEE